MTERPGVAGGENTPLRRSERACFSGLRLKRSDCSAAKCLQAFVCVCEFCTDWVVFQTACFKDGTTMDLLKVGVDPDRRAGAGT